MSGFAAQRKILIVGPSWVGDMVMAQSLFMLLKEHGAEVIDVLAPGWSRPLLARMPQVRKAIELPIGHGQLALGTRWRTGVALREEQYDQAILLPNSFKSALVPKFARIPLRTGWRGEARTLLLNDCRILDPQRLPLMVQRFVALGVPTTAAPEVFNATVAFENCPRPSLQISADSVQQTLAQLDLPAAPHRLILCPGAEFGPSKQWPAGHFAELAARAMNEGWQVVIVGSGNDAMIAAQIDGEVLGRVAGRRAPAPGQGNPECINLTGRTTLGQVIDLLSTATAVVSNDSGLMHIAAALQRPLLALYGSTSADFTPPLSEPGSDRVRLLASDISCRPCFQRTCPLGHKRCLTELTPAMAWAGVQDVIASPTPKGV